MTVPVDLVDPTALKDPVEEFFRQGGIDVTVNEQEGISAKQVTAIAVALGASFLVYRALMHNELDNALPPQTKGEGMKLLERAFYRVAPLWARAALPAAVAAYQLGSYDVRTISQVELETLANAYVKSLGEYMHKTSAEAMLDGFQAQMNARWSAELAWQRSVAGYGLDGPGTKAYVTALSEGIKVGYIPDPIPQASVKMVETALGMRAKRFGDTEAWSSIQTARNVVWMAQEVSGDLPLGMRKRWYTAHDERVCVVCGPLHQRVIPLKSKFHANNGEKFYAPGVHPNCRCRIELVYPEGYSNSLEELITKARPGDPYNRDRDGQFSSRESRGWTYREAADDQEKHPTAPRRARQTEFAPQKPRVMLRTMVDTEQETKPEEKTGTEFGTSAATEFGTSGGGSDFGGGSGGTSFGLAAQRVRQRTRAEAAPQTNTVVYYVTQTKSGQKLDLGLPPPPVDPGGGKPPLPEPEPIGFLGFSLDNAQDNALEVRRGTEKVSLEDYDPELGDTFSFSRSWTEEHGYLFDFGILGPVSPALQMENADWEEARRNSSRDLPEAYYGQHTYDDIDDSSFGGKTAVTFYMEDAIGFKGEEDRVPVGHYKVVDVEDLEPTPEQSAVGITLRKRVALEYFSHEDWQVK